MRAHEFYPGSLRKGEINIGDGVVVGQGITLFPGIEIGDNAAIGAGSVVNKDVEAGTVVAGNATEKIKRTSNL